MAQTPEVRAAVTEITGEALSAIKAKIESLRKGKKLTPAQIREGLDLLFQQYDFSPVESLVKLAMCTQDENLQARVCMFLTELVLPKLKSVEVSGSVDHTHTVVIRRFGPAGEVQDSPLRRVPGLPAARPVERVIDEEVTGE